MHTITYIYTEHTYIYRTYIYIRKHENMHEIYSPEIAPRVGGTRARIRGHTCICKTYGTCIYIRNTHTWDNFQDQGHSHEDTGAAAKEMSHVPLSHCTNNINWKERKKQNNSDILSHLTYKCMRMYIYIHVYEYDMYIHVYIYTRVNVHICEYVHVYIWYAYEYRFMCTCMDTYQYIYKHIYINIYVYKYINIYKHIDIYIYI